MVTASQIYAIGLSVLIQKREAMRQEKRQADEATTKPARQTSAIAGGM